MLKPIKQQKISDQVFEQIRELIIKGKFKPGEKLLPERDLAKSLNVSRTSVRNAISRLVTMGLIVNRQGQGTFVAVCDPKLGMPFSTDMKAKDATLFDLLEVRMGLECQAASLAAKRADRQDILAMEQSIEEMEKEIQAGHLAREADISFHMAVTYAAKNPLHIQAMRNFYNHLFHGSMENLRFLYKDPKNLDLILEQHKVIIADIINRDQDKAFTSMQQHIDFVWNFIKMSENKAVSAFESY